MVVIGANDATHRTRPGGIPRRPARDVRGGPRRGPGGADRPRRHPGVPRRAADARAPDLITDHYARLLRPISRSESERAGVAYADLARDVPPRIRGRTDSSPRDRFHPPRSGTARGPMSSSTRCSATRARRARARAGGRRSLTAVVLARSRVAWHPGDRCNASCRLVHSSCPSRGVRSRSAPFLATLLATVAVASVALRPPPARESHAKVGDHRRAGRRGADADLPRPGRGRGQGRRDARRRSRPRLLPETPTRSPSARPCATRTSSSTSATASGRRTRTRSRQPGDDERLGPERAEPSGDHSDSFADGALTYYGEDVDRRARPARRRAG